MYEWVNFSLLNALYKHEIHECYCLWVYKQEKGLKIYKGKTTQITIKIRKELYLKRNKMKKRTHVREKFNISRCFLNTSWWGVWAMELGVVLRVKTTRCSKKGNSI